MTERERKSVVEMANGAILERVDYEMARVLDNILDPNTSATFKRKVTVTIVLAPDGDRRVVQIGAVAKPTLAPTNAVATSLYITADENGEMTAVEMTPQIPGQRNLDNEEQAPAPILKIAK